MSGSARAIEVPIIIFAFDRAPYLRRFCLSLKAQQGVVLDERRIFLLQDGAVSRRSGVRYAQDEAMAESVLAFRSVFPQGQVVASPENLGIAGNLRRGERLAFEALDADLAYFFEDDLELGPFYLLMMERLREALAPHPQVAYFAAYGDHRVTPRPDRVNLMPLDHHWGFGLRRDAWRRISEELAPYYALLDRTDYRHRNHLAIHRWQEGRDMAIDKSSQDAMKAVAAARLGYARVMTEMCFARYIGEKGASFNERIFRQLGYDRMVPAERGDLPIEPVDAAMLQRMVAIHQTRFRRFREQEFPAFLRRFAESNWDMDRMLERDDVTALYRLLLDRLPEGEHIYEECVGRQSVAARRLIIVCSNEFRSRNF
ncbi:hypothetical protein [Pseudoroseomonas cervicalis]|uniref:hypothetical protein n=1 Tax=Teichococcus cervicalis TaxID=204525 RepID=UPI0022F1A9AB|nr:hypothetical protein [Pseudoroseomonas cervicalis]WBV43609.1 hypothetical protein PFY06_03340 [Pseudoroseomonas cervicalis]